MKLTAAIQELKTLSNPSQVDFYTDSQYLRRGITEWIPNWQARNWRRKGGKLANVDLWQALDKAIQTHQINWRWVKGQADDRKNQHVDYLARKSIPRTLQFCQAGLFSHCCTKKFLGYFNRSYRRNEG